MGSSQSDGLVSSVCESLGTRPNETKKASSTQMPRIFKIVYMVYMYGTCIYIYMCNLYTKIILATCICLQTDCKI